MLNEKCPRLARALAGDHRGHGREELLGIEFVIKALSIPREQVRHGREGTESRVAFT